MALSDQHLRPTWRGRCWPGLVPLLGAALVLAGGASPGWAQDWVWPRPTLLDPPRFLVQEEEEDLLDAFGDSDDGDEDLLDAFGDDGDEAGPGAGGTAGIDSGRERLLPPWFEIDGSLSFAGAYNYVQKPPVPQRGLSKLRTTLRTDLLFTFSEHWDAQASGIAFYDAAYSFKGRDKFTEAVLDHYEQEVELRELFVQGQPVSFADLKLGRQIVVWGFADFIRIVDILNPIENRDPGLADVEDTRLPVGMSRADLYFGDFALQGVVVHEIEFNKEPVFGSDFFPADQPSPPEDIPTDGGSNQEYGASLVGRFSGWDLGLYYARYFNDTAHLEAIPFNGIPQVQLLHSRLILQGAGVNVAVGNWLIKGESALIDGLEFASLPGQTKRRWDALLGWDYSGFNDTTIIFEAVNRRILDYDDLLKGEVGEDTNQYVLSYQGDFLNQRLHLDGILIYFGSAADDGGVQRYSLGYDVFDAFTATAGVLIFESGGEKNPLLQLAKDNDRLFFDLKYSF